MTYCVQGDIARNAHFGCNGSGYSEELSYTLNTMDVPVVTQRPVLAFCAGQSPTSGTIAVGCEVSPTLRASASGTNQVPTIFLPAGANPEAAAIELCPSQTASQGKTPPVICVADSNARSAIDVELAGSLKVGGDVPCVAINCRNYDVTTEMSGTLLAKPNGGFSMNYQNPIAYRDPARGMVIRRLTPVECERLQGFPDGWTAVPFRGKPADECPDTLRYKALGNSMAVPVMLWIGKRIEMVERIEKGKEQE